MAVTFITVINQNSQVIGNEINPPSNNNFGGSWFGWKALMYSGEP